MPDDTKTFEVPGAMACTGCGESFVDDLRWCSEIEVRCLRCNTIYEPEEQVADALWRASLLAEEGGGDDILD